MKVFKSFCSIILVVVVLFCMGVCAFAYANTSYSIDIPYEFTETTSTSTDTCWENADGSVVIMTRVTENTKGNKKINPSDISDSQLKEFENTYKEDFIKQYPNGEMKIISTNSSIMELGEHDAIRAFINAEYLGDAYYIYVYVFETENYNHTFMVMEKENKPDFADGLIRTVKINDEPIESDVKLKIIIGCIALAFICAAIIFTWFRIKKNPSTDNVRKWVYIGICVAFVVAIFIKVVIPLF